MAGSTYSSNLKIELMTTGENSGTWGDITNTNLGTALEQAVVGYGNPDYVSDANLTISITNSNAAQPARALVLNVTSTFGSLTQTRELVVPTIQKQYIVQNNTTGGQSITVKTSAGTGITVPNGRKAHLYVDGTNVIQMFDFVDINGGAIDGTTIGASSASTGAFTTLNASGATTLDGNVTLGNASGDTVTVTGTISSNLLFTDNTYDIGASGATRPRNLYLAGAATIGGNLSVGGTLTLTGGVNLNGNVTVGDSAADTLTINSTVTSNLIFTDNTYDIGASGATRPRNLFIAGNITAGGSQTLTGALTVDSTTDSSSTTTGSIQTDGGVGIAKKLYVGSTANISGAGIGGADDRILTVTNTAANSYGAMTLVGTSRGGYLNFYNGATAQAAIVGQASTLSIYAGSDSSGTAVANFVSTGQLGVGLTPTNNSYLIQSNSGIRAGTSVVAQGSLNSYTGVGIFMSYESTYGRIESYDYATPGYKDIGISPNGGNVGVGMVGTSTYGKLTVNGNIAQYGSVASGAELGRIAWFNTSTGYDVASIRTFIGAGQVNRGEFGFYTNTGAAQTLAMYISRTQFVGIGTSTTPAYNLDVNVSAPQTYAARIINSSGSFSTDSALLVSTSTASGARIISAQNSGTEVFSITGAGLTTIGAVGGNIAATSPLSVQSGITVANGLYTFGQWTTSSTGDVILTANAYPANIGSNSNIIFKLGTSGGGGPNEAGRFTSAGQFLVGTTTTSGGEIARFQTASGATNLGIIAATNGSSFVNFGDTSDANVGFIGYDHTNNYMNFRTNGGERIRVSSTGNVSIGTTANQSTLQVLRNGFTNPSYSPTMMENAIASFSGGGGDWLSIGQYTDSRIWIQASYQTSSPYNIVFQPLGGSVIVTGALSKGSGSFRISHPLPELEATHELVHSFIEGPQADLIYRGKVTLVNGVARVNIDLSTGMTEGTFVALNRDVQCFTTNESGWSAVRGSVSGNVLTIEAQDNMCVDTISWMVIGERQDKHMYETDWTDENGKVILEPLKPSSEQVSQ